MGVLDQILPGGAPWQQPDWKGWGSQLRGPPMKLLIICALQTTVLLIGLFIGIGKAECNTSHNGVDVSIDCETCTRHPYVPWQQIVLLLVGIVVILIGICAAVFRSKRLCKIYGLIMMIFAFIIGLTSLLTGLEAVVLTSALKDILDANCADAVNSMIQTNRINSILDAINCILDCAGALYAIKSKELFEFQEIAEHHAAFQKSYSRL